MEGVEVNFLVCNPIPFPLQFASRHYTFRMPSDGYRGIFNLYLKMTKPIVTPLTVAFCLNLILGMFITYREIVDFHSIMHKVDRKLELLENS